MSVPLLPRVAYFCMEYALSEEFPIYSGGLGVLAGDHVKSAADLGVPLVAIGIFWSEGYTRQRLGPTGVPVDAYPVTPREALTATGAKATVTIRGREVTLIAWRVNRHGAGELYLLEPEREEDRWLTRRLYSGGPDLRVAQEIVLGVGGVRMLRALGVAPDVYHFNEGHAVFAGLELVRERMVAGATFPAACAAVRQEIVFTTHTPVLAGNETHALPLLREQGADLGAFSDEQLEALGGAPFGMTVAGLRLSRIANGVAALHGETTRRMWKGVEGAAPITSVTNGVHSPTWQDSRVRAAYSAGPAAILAAHQEAKRELITEVRARSGVALAEERLIIGFARRAASYKRADLILRDPKMNPLLAEGRVQLVFSGKAHPNDTEGKQLVAALAAASKRFPTSVVFLEDYEMRLGRLLTRGCDVWLNNPRRPMEASGTSGMKAAMNGVLNLSVLDGWWPEGCEHGVTGWQLGDGYEGPGQDEHDLKALVAVLLGEVLPIWETDRTRWGQMMQASIAMSQWRFSSDRMVEEYYERIYRRAPLVRAAVG
ncbi:MAG: alpha-glucan family phosphorylase [Myxococcales bacterium]|nr:alpha-glucan family phosphorylase [Myxococcales bacterium]